jgi:putative aldouronate transport system permease protein
MGKIKHGFRLSSRDIIFFIIAYTLFSLFTFLCVFPFWYLFINTISNNELVRKGAIIFLPQGIHLDNYIDVFRLRGLWQAFIISIGRTVIGTFLTVLASAFVGYLVTKREMWGRKFWYRFVIITMFLNAGLIPWYMTMYNLRLTNNFLAYLLPFIVSPFFIILVKTYIESIPVSLEEAAIVDGAGYLKRFTRIIFPLSVPILATVAIFSAVTQWNSFIDTLFLMTKENLFTLQFVLQRYLKEADYLAMIMRTGSSLTGVAVDKMVNPRVVQMTVTMVVVLPILIVYPVFQRYFIKGIMMGAIKG